MSNVRFGGRWIRTHENEWFPHVFQLIGDVYAEDYEEVEEWCYQNISDVCSNTGRWFCDGFGVIWIREEADAFAFRMRWC